MATLTADGRARALSAAQDRAFALEEKGEPLEQVLAALVTGLESAFDKRVVGSILLVDDHEAVLRHGAAPSLPGIYNRAVDGLPLGAYGTCCKAAHQNCIVVTPDIAADAGWAKLQDYPLTLGLVAAWSMPIRASDGRVLGTFGSYFRDCRLPAPAEQQAVQELAHTAGVLLARRAAAEARETKSVQLAQ